MSTVTSCSALLLHTSNSKMESFEENNGDKDKLLEPPSATDLYTEEDDVKATIKPRLSPLPRRRASSVSSDDGELEPPPTVTRKVSFADAFGFDLVSVKEFDTWEVPIVSQTFETESTNIEEFYLTPSFILPSIGGIMESLHTKKVTLESVDFIPGVTSMKGIIRVLNLSYEKQLYVRMSLDDWHSFYDLLAEYIPDSSNGKTDQFGFTISLVSPYQKEGARVEFCICYETAIGTFWDNNDGCNYVLTCQKKEKFVEVDKPSEDVADKNKKSCLKPAVSKEDEDMDVFAAEEPAVTEQHIPRIICTHDEYTEGNNDEQREDTREETNNAEERDLEVFLSQRLMNARITSSDEQYNTETSDLFNLQTEKEQYDEIKYHSETQDHYSQSQSPDNKEEYPPVAEPNPSLVAEDFSNTSHHSAEALSHEYSKVIEEAAFFPAELKRDTSDICQETSEAPPFVQDENMKVTEILDHNANPSYSENPVHMAYFSTDNTKEMQYEHSENIKTETENSQEDNNVPTEYDGTEGLGIQYPITFPQLDDYQDLLCQYEPFSSVDPPEHVEANQSASSPAISGDVHFFKESKVEGIDEETSHTKNVTAGLSQDTETTDAMSVLLEENKYVTVETTDLSGFQSVPLQISKQYFDTTQNPNSRHTAQETDNKYGMRDRNVVLSDNNDSYDITYPSYEDKGIASDQTDRTIFDTTETKPSCETESLPECPPSIACSTAENVSLGTLHVWNEMLGPFPSEVTPGNKVIIAKITEEKGQSETCSQGRDDSKRSYIDLCDSGSEAQLTDSSAKSKLKRGDLDHTSKPMHVPCDREGIDDIEGEKIDTSNLRTLSKEGTGYMPKELGNYEYENRLNDVLGESDIHNADLNHVTQPSNSKSFTELREDTDVRLLEDFTKETNGKKVIEYVDLELKVITEEDVDIEQDSPEQTFMGPSILISGPDDEEESQSTDTEEQGKPEDTHQYYYHPFTDDEMHTDQEITTDTETREDLNISHASSKVFCFIMFVVFAGLMYHYDFLVCFALYLFSLYWLYWEGDRGKTMVRKE
ncbi:PREDICTED: protein phosphatase 1 regulatory subunit 3A [Nanorana parkeri]|uniref:protein phosphatase 1 regulatory subunit 3A n=1 Tax=Nanorana parkeri TaxID=125878 RepID=UPI000854ACAF|nr:PREDICTED: protein phosphatase 1 regulatory subunit 3A [Nanorana parkeri]